MRRQSKSWNGGNRGIAVLLLSFSVSFLARCNFYEPREQSRNPRPKPAEGSATTYSWLRSEVLVPRCLSCHTGATARNKQVDLSSYSSTMASKKVSAGKPDKSVLFKIVDSDEMPPDGALPQSEKNWIHDWIKQGATP